jgi:phage terminase large subunit-like protein
VGGFYRVKFFLDDVEIDSFDGPSATTPTASAELYRLGGQTVLGKGTFYDLKVWQNALKTDPAAVESVFDGTFVRSTSGIKTTSVTRPVMLLDGTDDFGQLPSATTPTFTAVSGKHTVVVAFRVHHVTAGWNYIYSSYDGVQGLAIRMPDSGDDIKGIVRGSNSLVTTTKRDIVLGDFIVGAVVCDEGAIRAYESTSGFTADADYTAVGTITHQIPRLGTLALGGDPSSVEVFDVLDYPGEALTQKRFLLEQFEVTNRGTDDAPVWLRRHRWGLVGIPKKNGKTELGAGVGVYLAVDDEEPSAKVVCAAASDDQANLLYTAASKICNWSPTLEPYSEVKNKHIEFDTGDIAPGELRRVAAVAGANDGKNNSGVLIDELHEWIAPKSRAVFTVLTQGGGARRQPINIMITTAGSDEDSICYELYEHGLNVRSGETIDDSFYFLWYEAPVDADYKDPETWKKANPSWGLILKQEFYEDIITKRSESEFCRYFLNRWMEADDIWEAAIFWPGLEGETGLRDDLPTYIGIDIGRRHDSSAVVTTQWDGKLLHVKSKFWMNPHPPGSERGQKWALNIGEVEDYLKEEFKRYPEPSVTDEEDGYREPGPAFLYDPHFFVRSAELLEGEGMSMVEFPQSDTKMVPASQNLFELIKTGAVVHDGNEILTKHMRSVVAKFKERGWRISRPEGSRKHIDGAVALAMAAYAASAEFDDQEQPFNIY